MASLAFNESIELQDYVHDFITFNFNVVSSVFFETSLLLYLLVGLVSNDGVAAISVFVHCV